jgi:hypothetical protein
MTKRFQFPSILAVKAILLEKSTLPESSPKAELKVRCANTKINNISEAIRGVNSK